MNRYQQFSTFEPVGEKLATSKAIHQVKLSNNVYQTENFTEPVTQSVHVVLFKMHQQVIDQDSLLDNPLFGALQTRIKAKNDSFHKFT